jgi:transcriptional regulator with XRE-family HTH domain
MARRKSTHVDSPALVGERIRSLREERGLRQRDLAFDGCTAAYISRIEAGARIPSLQLLREIGKRLGVSADYLATGATHSTSAEALALTDSQLAQRLGDEEGAGTGFRQLSTSDDPDIRRDALLGLAQLALERGEVRDSIALLEEHEQLGGGTAAVEPAAVEALAHAYATGGDLAAALALVERKLEASDDLIVRFRLTVTLTNVLIDLNQLDRAETLIGDSLGTLGSSPDPIALARCLWSQSRLQTARGNIDLAASYAEQALSVIKATEHEEYAARAHQLLAHIELKRGEPRKALALLDDALPLVQRGGDRPLIATFQLERARALTDLGELDEARTLAADLVRQLEGLSRVDSARALSLLADIFAKTGDTEQALSMYDAAATELAGHEHEAMLIDVYTRWSDLLAQTGDTSRALEIARRALNSRPQVRNQ